jgi:predicted esterase
VLLHGGADPIVPLAAVSTYAAAAKQAGDTVNEVVDPALGHFDPAVPGNALGDAAVKAVRELLGE